MTRSNFNVPDQYHTNGAGADQAPWYMIGGYTVLWVTSESPHGHEPALHWGDWVERIVHATYMRTCYVIIVFLNLTITTYTYGW